MSNLLQSRILFLKDEIDIKSSNDIIQNLLYLHSLNNDKIQIYIQSRGGDVYAAINIIDIITYIIAQGTPIDIITMMGFSAAFIIGIHGSKRYAFKNSSMMFHEPSSTCQGKISTLDNYTNEIHSIYKVIQDIIKKKTKIPSKIINSHLDVYITPVQAMEWKIIDEIL